MSDKSLLQDFSELVAADVLGVSKTEVSAAVEAKSGLVRFDPISFLAFIEAIMAMISKLMENCPQNDADVRESVKRPNIRQRVAVRVAVQRDCECYGEAGWRRRGGVIARSLIHQGGQQSDETIDTIIADCRNNTLGVR